MKSESIVLAVAGICFGVIVGWVLASVDASRRPVVAQAPAAATAAPATTAAGNDRQPPTLDEARVQALTTILQDKAIAESHPYWIAQAYALRGETGHAVEWLERTSRGDLFFLLDDPLILRLRVVGWRSPRPGS